MTDTLWVVTSYYNPVRYRRRLENFRAFRRNLQAPLLVVELARPGAHRLGDGDAEIVVSLTGEDRIWQKERLINIGVGRLPDDARYVAWCDCDLIFDDPDWPAAARRRLDEAGGMVQLFDAAAHMPDNLDPRAASPALCREVAPLFVKLSFPRALSAGIVKPNPNANLRSVDPSIGKSVSHGKAWAARRDIIEACGHFDKAIVGGGDTVHIQASCDMLDEEYLVKYDLPRGYRAAAHAWAKTARRTGLFQSVSSLDRRAYHLWHGEIADRGYLSRLEILSWHDYDPDRDLRLADNGTWAWADPKGALAADVEAYFSSRFEDGRV